MRVVLMGLLMGGLLGCGGVEMTPEEEAAPSAPAETQRVQQAVYVPCTRSNQCIEYGQQYCGGDPGLCWKGSSSTGSCLCP
jgi:hypothetical protein